MEMKQPFTFEYNDIWSVDKKCPFVNEKNNCQIDVYCPFKKKDEFKITQNTIVPVVTSGSENDKKKINLIDDDQLNKIHGDEVIMITFINYYWNEQNKLERIKPFKKPDRRVHHLKSIIPKNMIMKALKNGTPVEKKLSCPNTLKTISTLDVDMIDVKLTEYYIKEKKYPVFCYDEPIVVKFPNNNNNDQYIFRAVIKFMFQNYKYFLFEYFKLEHSAAFHLIDLTTKPKSHFQYTFQPADMIIELSDCETKHNITNKDKYFPMKMDLSSEYILHISKINKVTYTIHNLIKNPGCILCYGNHTVNNCEFICILDNNQQDKFLNSAENIQEKKIGQYTRFTKKYKIQKQNSFDYQNIKSIENPPILFVVGKLTKIINDNTEKYIFDVSKNELPYEINEKNKFEQDEQLNNQLEKEIQIKMKEQEAKILATKKIVQVNNKPKNTWNKQNKPKRKKPKRYNGNRQFEFGDLSSAATFSENTGNCTDGNNVPVFNDTVKPDN